MEIDTMFMNWMVNRIKMSVFLKLIYRIDAISTNNFIGLFFFVDIDNIILKCMWKGKGSRTFLKKNNKVERSNLLNFKTYSKIYQDCVTLKG